MSPSDAARGEPRPSGAPRVVCAYCGAEQTAQGWRLPSGARLGLVSHGICPNCFEGHVEAELRDWEAGREARRDRPTWGFHPRSLRPFVQEQVHPLAKPPR